MTKHRRFGTNFGFTIVEMLIVISVIAIIVTIVTISYKAYLWNSVGTQIAATNDSYVKSLKGYALEYNSFPKYPSCLPSGSKCCFSTAAAPTGVTCGTDVENAWNTNSQATNVGKYVNSDPPYMPVFAEFTNCTAGAMVSGPCKATSTIKTGLTYIYNTTGAQYTSTDPNTKGFLIYYIGPTYECKPNDIMVLSGNDLVYSSTAKFTRSTSTYRECIIGIKTTD